jgi:hypothetical protein
MRKSVKQAIVKQLAAHYSLTTATTPEDITLLKMDDNYILPRDENKVSCLRVSLFVLVLYLNPFNLQNPILARPFGHPILLAIIQDEFFTGSDSIGACALASKSFKTSLPDKAPLYQEPEMPAAMLALVATAVSHRLSYPHAAHDIQGFRINRSVSQTRREREGRRLHRGCLYRLL